LEQLDLFHRLLSLVSFLFLFLHHLRHLLHLSLCPSRVFSWQQILDILDLTDFVIGSELLLPRGRIFSSGNPDYGNAGRLPYRSALYYASPASLASLIHRILAVIHRRIRESR
jgi:hypothetical protein